MNTQLKPGDWNDINGGDGSAVSLPRSIVGTRHCRLLYINSGCTGIDINFPLNPILGKIIWVSEDKLYALG